MDLELNGRVALVTGGSGAIGGAIALQLAREGVSCALGYFKNAQAAHALCDQIRSTGGTAIALPLDVRNEDSVVAFFARAHEQLGRVDILVNSAGIAYFGETRRYALNDWTAIVTTNLTGTFLCCKAAINYMVEAGGGDIANISSLAARIGAFEGAAYAASKGGVDTFTRALALELASSNIRVNAVAPGRIATPFRRSSSGEYFDFMIEQTPMKRLGSVEEIATATTFLLSRRSSFLTGETLYVTGGLGSPYLRHVEPDPNSPLSKPPT